MILHCRLHDHPEGADAFAQDPDGSRSICGIQSCTDFVEVGFDFSLKHFEWFVTDWGQLTGDAGDVILLHPFMVSLKSEVRHSVRPDLEP